ncbi:transposase [Orientia tsutsugamushi]|uniref:transposase n=1 Tax=Orientia tsutsugamushi TaxID=784 RepID=UPI0009C16B4C|nr:transposase [Orientia tsutsugamushi]
MSFLFDANCNKSIFESCVQAILIKALTSEQTVILDNISFHNTVMVKFLIESVWCKLLYLPTYSPDLNLMWHYWFEVKNDICKVSYLFNNFNNNCVFMNKSKDLYL